MSSVRAFLAVPIPAVMKSTIAALQQDLAGQISSVRWSRPENLHLTLRFFGETDQEILERVKVSMLSIKGCARPFDVTVRGVGAFPSLTRPRVVWLGLEPMEEIRRFHAVCEDCLQSAGISPEGRPFTPHLTLGRLRSPSGSLVGAAAGCKHSALGIFRVDTLVLYQSRLRPGSAEHTPLATVTLED